MSMDIPDYDDAGINLADPNDRRGHKTHYISRLQIEALRQLVPRRSGIALDVGCGYGRMSEALFGLGYDRVIGIDPSARVLGTARRLCPGIEFLEGSLPDLPVGNSTADAVFLLNVLRALHLMGKLDVAVGAAKPIAPGGLLVILDNLRSGHPDYVAEERIVSMFEGAGLKLVVRCPIRGARWPWIFLVRYGLIPRSLHDRLAVFERALMRRLRWRPRFQYHNVVWVFEKAG